MYMEIQAIIGAAAIFNSTIFWNQKGIPFQGRTILKCLYSDKMSTGVTPVFVAFSLFLKENERNFESSARTHGNFPNKTLAHPLKRKTIL